MKITKLNFTAFVSGIILLQSYASAKPLLEYRKELPAYRNLQKDQVDKDADQIIKKVLRSTDQGLQLPMALLQSDRLAKLSSEPRISFSTNIGRFLSKNSSELRFDEEFAKPTTVNPKWSVEQSRSVKQERINNLCRTTLQSFKLDELAKDLAAEGQRTAKSGYSNLVLDPRQEADLKLINEKILSANLSNSGASIASSIGQARHLEIVNSVIQEIHVSKSNSDNLSDQNTLSISLPILIGAKLDTNKQFSRSLDCLETYFREQADILTIRQAELKGEPAAQKVKDLIKKVEDLYRLYLTDQKVRVRLTEYSFKMIQYMELSANEPAAAYLLKRSQYLLGKDLSPEKEIALNEERLSQAQYINPYLKMKAAGAKFAISQLKKLNDKEINALIWFMTSIRGSEIPSSVDVSALETVAKNDKAGKTELADYLSAKKLYDSLTSLSMRMQEPKP